MLGTLDTVQTAPVGVLPFTFGPDLTDDEAALELGIDLPVMPDEDEQAGFDEAEVASDDDSDSYDPGAQLIAVIRDEQAASRFIAQQQREAALIEAGQAPRREVFKLPEDVLDVLRQASDDITRSKWLVTRVLIAYIADLPPLKATALRAEIIKQAAVAVQTEDAAVREWVHTGEVIPEGTEDNPRYMGWGFSLFARAARMGEAQLALNVLEIARERLMQYGPGCPPPCWAVNAIVKEQKARLKGATEDELDRLREEARARIKSRFTGFAVQLNSIERLVILVPEDSDIGPGDEVVVMRKGDKA